MPEPEQWWEGRRDGEATADYLARVLHDLGAYQVAANARMYHYDDFFCPEEIDDGANIHRLVRDVADWAANNGGPDRARMVIEAAKNGEFDGTREESRAWVQSAEGQALMRDLLGGK